MAVCWEKNFNEFSDIDLSVKGLGDKYLKALGYCIWMSDFEIDIREYKDLPERIKDVIDKRLKLYG